MSIPLPGDLLFIHSKHSYTSRAIRFAQKFRVDKEYAYWNHVAVFVDNTTIIEAKGRRPVRIRPLSDYKDSSAEIFHVKATHTDRLQIVEFCMSCLGQRYGYLTIISVLIWVMTHGKLVFFLDGTEICSGMAAQAQTRAGVIYPKSPVSMMPGDLAKFYGVKM